MSNIDKTKREIISFFERKEWNSVLLGDNVFFVKHDLLGPTTHNTGLVWQYLIEWLNTTANKDAYLLSLKDFLVKQISTNTKVNDVNSGLISIFLLRSYCVFAKEKGVWPISKIEVKEMLSFLPPFSEEEYQRLNIYRDIEGLNNYLTVVP